MSWVDGIQQSILWSLNQMQSSTSDSRKHTNIIPPEQALEAIRQNSGNKTCADCGTPRPDWASINIGTVFCIECAGVHRSLGVHISKVRSATLDEWTKSLLGITREIGAQRANAFWDPNYTANRPRQDADKETKEAYIRAKCGCAIHTSRIVVRNAWFALALVSHPCRPSTHTRDISQPCFT